MWRKIDLTGGEIEKLCRIAQRPELTGWLKGYYDNTRRQLLERLEWLCSSWLQYKQSLVDPDHDEDGNEIMGVEPAGNFQLQANPSEQDLLSRHGFLVSRKLMRDVWAPIDIVDTTVWEEKGNGNLWFQMVASRMLTYAQYRLLPLFKGNTTTITEQTHMYKPFYAFLEAYLMNLDWPPWIMKRKSWIIPLGQTLACIQPLSPVSALFPNLQGIQSMSNKPRLGP